MRNYIWVLLLLFALPGLAFSSDINTLNAANPYVILSNIDNNNVMTASYSTSASEIYSSDIYKTPGYRVIRPVLDSNGLGNWIAEATDSNGVLDRNALNIISTINSSIRYYRCKNATSGLSETQMQAEAIVGALRDLFSENFSMTTGTTIDADRDMGQVDIGQMKMLKFILMLYPNATNNYQVGLNYRITCTHAAQILAYFLNGYGIPAREWAIVAVKNYLSTTPGELGYLQNPAVPLDDPICSTGKNCMPLHGTIEYFDQGESKWFFADLMYGFSGVWATTTIPKNQSDCDVNTKKTANNPLNIVEWIQNIDGKSSYLCMRYYYNGKFIYDNSSDFWKYKDSPYVSAKSCGPSALSYSVNNNASVFDSFISGCSNFTTIYTWQRPGW